MCGYTRICGDSRGKSESLVDGTNSIAFACRQLEVLTGRVGGAIVTDDGFGPNIRSSLFSHFSLPLYSPMSFKFSGHFSMVHLVFVITSLSLQFGL